MARSRKPTSPTQDSPVRLISDNPKPEENKRLKVSAATLARSRQKLRKPGELDSFNPFVSPVFPPSVEPTKDVPSIAQDENISENFVWAHSAISSAFAEGVTFMGYAALSVLAQRPEYRVISEEIASEMTREWIELKSVSEDEDKSERIAELEDAIKEFNVQEAFQKVAEYDGFMGRGHIYIDTGDTDDRDELKTSLGDGQNLISKAKFTGENGRKKLIALRPVEAVWCYPTKYDSNNPLKKDWYKPENWMVMGTEVHVTRLLTFVGREVPDMLKPAYAFGGLSMTQMAKPYVDNWLKTRQSVADIISAFSVFVLMTQLGTSLSAGGDELFDRAELFNNMRDNRGLMMLDKELEDFKNVSASLATLDTLQAQSQEHLASVSRIPQVKLFGIQPAGLNASSEGEIRSFYDWIHAFQEKLFRKHLTTIIHIIMLTLWGEVDHSITFEFKDLWQLDEAGEAAVEKTRTDIDDANIAMGAISPEEVRKRLAREPKSQYAGLDLSEEMAPGIPGEGEDPDNPDNDNEETEGLKPKDPGNRLSSSITGKAARFGSPATLGFKGDLGLAADDLVMAADALRAVVDAEWHEEDHPRGQPGNTGQFGPGGGKTPKEGEQKEKEEEEEEHIQFMIYPNHAGWGPDYKKLLSEAPKPTKREAISITKYTGEYFDVWNSDIRGIDPSNNWKNRDQQFAYINELSNYLNRASLPEDKILYRYVKNDFADTLIDSLRKKDTVAFIDSAFTSCSATNPSRESLVVMEILLKKGSKAAAVGHYSENPDENEIIIQAGSLYEVTSFDSNTKTLKVVLIKSGEGPPPG